MSISKTVIERIVQEMLANAQDMGDIVVVPNTFEVYLMAKEHAEIQSLFNILRAQTEKRLERELQARNRTSLNGFSAIVSLIRRILGLGADDFDSGNKEYKRAEDFWDINFKSCDGKINVDNNIFELKKGEVGIIAQFSSPQQAVSLDSQFKTVFTVYSDDDGGAARRTTVETNASAEDDEFAARFEDENRRQPPPAAILKYKIKGETKTFPIIKEIISVGRRAAAVAAATAATSEPESDLALDCSEKVSHRHFEIRFDSRSNSFFLKSLGIYGTAVNGKKAPDSFKIADDGATRELNLEVELPRRARIALAGGEVILDFETGV